MGILIWSLALLSYNIQAQDDASRRIERDLNITVSQLQLLIDKDVASLMQDLSKPEQAQFEADVFEIKQATAKLSRQFATSGRLPSGNKAAGKTKK